ncbi:MAG TPA: hypothetical protein VFR58_16880 [Flavisolibacter sp.]|nr:hypothetical protein [Flavisolibacter sp.]
MKLIVLPIFIAFSLTARAQDIKATADKEQILIGEPFRLLLQAGMEEGSGGDWFTIDSIRHFEILEKGRIDTQRNGRSLFVTQVLTLTSWDSGRWNIPPFVLGRFQTEPVSINVVFSPSPFDINQPYHDIKDIIEVDKPKESKWHWYLIGIAVLIILFILFFPKEKKKPRPDFVPEEGAYKKALRKLDQLKENPPADVKSFYTQLVDVFREYLQKRRNIQSFSKTTDDLAIQVEKLALDREGYYSLVQALRQSDMAKFARYEPGSEENLAALETIRQSIITIEKLPDAV